MAAGSGDPVVHSPFAPMGEMINSGADKPLRPLWGIWWSQG
jgi:hypothetical protein